MYQTLLDIIEVKSEIPENDQNSDEGSFFKNIFLNRLLLLKNIFTIDQMKDHIYTTVAAGYETTGTASAHCILFLAIHQEIQEKAYQEIMKYFPTDDTPITHQTLLELDYLERVIKESLRLGPTVHSIARETMKDFELTPGEIIQKGSILVVNIYGLHRRKELWGDDVEVFNPDRFLPDNFTTQQQQSYIPFSAGKRNCIGYRYASYSFKVMIMKFLRNFKFSTTLKINDINFNRQVALKLFGPHSVTVEKRRQN